MLPPRAARYTSDMTKTTPALSDTHATVLSRLLDQDRASVAHPRVEASANPIYGFPFATLAAMDRRGLVRLSWARQGAIYGDPRPYRVAYLTEAGRTAITEHLAARPFQPGDVVRFRTNGVFGTVTRNLGPAVNTRTGHDVIEWHAGADGSCTHDAELLELVAPAAA